MELPTLYFLADSDFTPLELAAALADIEVAIGKKGSSYESSILPPRAAAAAEIPSFASVK